MGSKTMDLASAVLHKTIATPQQYFQAEASRLRAAMVAGGTESLRGASPTPPCGFPAPEPQEQGGCPVSRQPGRLIGKKELKKKNHTRRFDDALGERAAKQIY